MPKPQPQTSKPVRADAAPKQSTTRREGPDWRGRAQKLRNERHKREAAVVFTDACEQLQAALDLVEKGIGLLEGLPESEGNNATLEEAFSSHADLEGVLTRCEYIKTELEPFVRS